MNHKQSFGLIEAADERNEMHGYEVTMEGNLVTPDLKPQTRSALVFERELMESSLTDCPAA